MTAESAKAAGFVPRGAIAFFVVMVAFYTGLWFVLYLVMAQRG